MEGAAQEHKVFLTTINPSDVKRNFFAYPHAKVIDLAYNKFFSVATMF